MKLNFTFICFFVKSNLFYKITRHHKEVYFNLRKFLYDSNEQGGIEGYILEKRFWYYLFTGESYDTIYDCVKELFVDIHPIIKVYCQKRQKIWFKYIKKCTNIIENSYTYIIYTDKDKQQRVLPGVDCVGEDIYYLNCNNLNKALNLTNKKEKINNIFNFTKVNIIQKFHDETEFTFISEVILGNHLKQRD